MEPISDLLPRVWPDAYRIAYAVLGNRSEAEDAAQDACARLITSLDSLRSDSSFSAWFYQIVIHESYRHLRLRGQHEPLADDRPAINDVTEESCQNQDLRDALGRLPESQRLPVIFHYYYGFPDAEIARILHISYAAVRVRLFAARRKLRHILTEQPSAQGAVCQ